jgi:hypothetical protein
VAPAFKARPEQELRLLVSALGHKLVGGVTVSLALGVTEAKADSEGTRDSEAARRVRSPAGRPLNLKMTRTRSLGRILTVTFNLSRKFKLAGGTRRVP